MIKQNKIEILYMNKVIKIARRAYKMVKKSAKNGNAFIDLLIPVDDSTKLSLYQIFRGWNLKVHGLDSGAFRFIITPYEIVTEEEQEEENKPTAKIGFATEDKNE